MTFVTNDDVMGKNIRHYRRSMGLSSKLLADMIGMEEKELTALETDHSRQIQGDALEKLYNVFHTSVKYLVEQNIKS